MEFIAADSGHSSEWRRLRQSPSSSAHAAPAQSQESRSRDFLDKVGAVLRDLRRDLANRRLDALERGRLDQEDALRRDVLKIVARRRL